jgi:hypothetical protein
VEVDVGEKRHLLVPLYELVAKDASVEIELADLAVPKPEAAAGGCYLDNEGLLGLMRVVLHPEKSGALRSRHILVEFPEERSIVAFRGNFDSFLPFGLVGSVEGTIVDFYSSSSGEEVANLVVQLAGQKWKALLHPRDLIERGAKVRIGID